MEQQKNFSIRKAGKILGLILLIGGCVTFLGALIFLAIGKESGASAVITCVTLMRAAGVSVLAGSLLLIFMALDKKKAVLAALFLVLFIAVLGVIRYYSAPARRVPRYVKQHEKELASFVDRYLESAEKPERFEKNAVSDFAVTASEEGASHYHVIVFTMGAVGLVPSEHRWGFYYSPDDVPAAVFSDQKNLNETEDGFWEWIEYGDNHGITGKIMDSWYYWEYWD